MELLDPKGDPQLIISQHIMNIQQNKYNNIDARLTLPKLFLMLLTDQKMLMNTSTTLIGMLESKDITNSTICLILDILDSILANASYQAQSQFSGIYYKLIKNYKSNTILYHLLSMDCMQYLEVDQNNTLTLYRLLRGFMHFEHKKIKLKAIQQYYIFCIQNHSIVSKANKIFNILDIFLDRNMVTSHMIREKSSQALSTLLYFYSKQTVEQPQENDEDDDMTKQKKKVKKIESFTEADVLPALFRNMELAFLERDYVAYLCEVLGRYLNMKGKKYMEQSYGLVLEHISKLLSSESFNKLYFSDQYFVYTCLSFVMRKDVSSLLTHDDGFMPAINVLIEYLEQWPSLIPNKPSPNTWVLGFCMLELGNYISLAGTNVTSFENLQTIIFRYLEHQDDILITSSLYCLYGIMQADASYVRKLANSIYPFLKDDVPKLKSVSPDIYLKKYYAYSMALMVILVYWSEHMQMTATDLDIILKIVKSSLYFRADYDNLLLVQELVRNSGWQILGYLMDVQEVAIDIEQDVVGFLQDMKGHMILPAFPIKENEILKFFTETTSCLRFLRKCLSKKNYRPSFMESAADLLEEYLRLAEQLPSLFGSMSLTAMVSLRTEVLNNLNDRELMFRSLVFESTVLLSEHHKNGKNLLVKHLDNIFKKHARLVFQLEYDIFNVEQHNSFYKSRANGSFLGTVLHFLDHLPKATAVNLNSNQYIDLYRISSDTHVKLFFFELDFAVFKGLTFRDNFVTIGSPMPYMRCISAFCKFIQKGLPLSDQSVQRQFIQTCGLFLQTHDVKSALKRKTAFVIFSSMLGNSVKLDAVCANNAYKLLFQYTQDIFSDVPHLISELLSRFGESLDEQTACAIVKDLLDKTISNPDVDKRHYQFVFLTSMIKSCAYLDQPSIDVIYNVIKSLIQDAHPLAHASALVGLRDVSAAPFLNSGQKYMELYLSLYSDIYFEEYFILNDVLGMEADHFYEWNLSSILSNLLLNLGADFIASDSKTKVLDLATSFIVKNNPNICLNAFDVFEFLISFKFSSKLPFTSKSLLSIYKQSENTDLRKSALKLLKQLLFGFVDIDAKLPLQQLIMSTEDAINKTELGLIREMCLITVEDFTDFTKTFDLLKSILNRQAQDQQTIDMKVEDDEGQGMISHAEKKSSTSLLPSSNSQITSAACLLRMIEVLQNRKDFSNHLNTKLIKTGDTKFLINKIQDLISISFNCSTSSNMELKFYGLTILQDCLLVF
eukprot:NODE_40_length_35084_cov_0.543519.p2 type:complete len:1234 gc:universal NODE_40_length_35084_cov_0.543519:10345-6644(-)